MKNNSDLKNSGPDEITDEIVDVIVIGGGLAGLTLTSALAEHSTSVICIDKETPKKTLSPDFDGRTTAISAGSRRVLETAGVWKKIEDGACPIETIEIRDGDSPVLLAFESREVGDTAFGWIAENRHIRQILLNNIKNKKRAAHIAPGTVNDFRHCEDYMAVRLDDGREYKARLVVGADGRGSFTRECMGIGARQWSYKQRAIVCVAYHEEPHGHIAIENFYPQGPFALLPMLDDDKGRHRSSVVWTEHGPDRYSARHYDDETFAAALQSRMPRFYGTVTKCTKRFSYPLGLVHAHRYTAPRIALVAEAAHGIHPIAGQGLNMGFRDIAALAALVSNACQKGEDPGNGDLLAIYQRQRRFDNMVMAGATDSLNKLFSNDLKLVKTARRFGVHAVSRLPVAKQFFMKQAMGKSGMLPSLMQDKDKKAG